MRALVPDALVVEIASVGHGRHRVSEVNLLWRQAHAAWKHKRRLRAPGLRVAFAPGLI